MVRTSSMRHLRRVVAAARYARASGLSGREALDELRQRARSETALRLEAPPTAPLPGSRRAFLRGVGAAAMVGAGLELPRVARATKASTSSARIAIVGAGLGGLACADALLAAGVAADVYEAGERVGGRVYSIGGAFPSAIDLLGQVTELGGEFVDTGHSTMRGYATRFGLAMEDVLKEFVGEPLFYAAGAVRSDEEVVDEYQALVDAMHVDLRALSNDPTAASHTDADVVLDYTNLEEYLVTRGAPPIIADVVREAYRNEYGREIDELSCLTFLQLIHADNRSKWQPWGVFSDERFHLVGGNQQIPEALAAQLGGRLYLGHHLEAATRVGSAFRLTFAVGGGPVVELDYDYVVLALPFSALRELDLDDAALGLPPEKRLVIDTLQYGTNSKRVVGFAGRPWNAAGWTGEIVAYGLADLNSTWESQPIGGGADRALLMDYSGGARGAAVSETDPAGTERFLADLDGLIPGASASARRVGGQVVAQAKNWSADALHRGAYTANQPGYFTTLADTEATRVGNLLFAGEHCDSFYAFQGWMEGAALSGNAAAAEILADLR